MATRRLLLNSSLPSQTFFPSLIRRNNILQPIINLSTRSKQSICHFSTNSVVGSGSKLSSETSVDESPKSQKGFFSKMWDKYSPQGQQHRIEMGERLFRAAQLRSNDPTWYDVGRIGREFRPRHAILTMHVWFLHKRLISDTIDPHQSLLVQEELFDILWNDTRARIRAEGVNELTVNKHLKDVQQVTFQHCTHYDHAFSEYASEPDKRFEELAGAVWMHILLKDEDAHDDHLRRLAAYVEFQYDNIMFQLPDEYFHEGRIDWGTIPEFDNMRDSHGRLLDKVVRREEDYLPGGWVHSLTDSGEVYYWNTETNQTQWERPTSG